MEKINILVVEDNKEEQNAAIEQLSETGNDITIVGSFNEAMRAMENKKYDVLLTDIFFPFGFDDESYYPLQTPNEARKPEALGYPLMWMAMQKGIRKIGAISDANHHSGALAAMTDYLINEKKVGGDNLFAEVFIFIKRRYDTPEDKKDWLRVLKTVLGEEVIKEYGNDF